MVLEIKQYEGRPEGFLQFQQGFAGEGGVESIGLIRFSNGIEFVDRIVERLHARFATMGINELAIKGGEEPGLDLAGRIDLVSFGGELAKGFLGEVEGGRLAVSE